MTHDDLHRYEATKQRLADALDALSLELGPVDDAMAARLTQLAERTRDNTFRVVLLGCFSSGKSTLLNALLGRPVLPVKVNPCTAVLTEVRWAEEPGVVVHHRDGQTEPLDLDAFLDRYQIEGGEDDAGAALDRFSGVDKAVIGWPLPLLRHGVVFVDTPGLDDDPLRTERTLGTLPHADAVLVVLNATRFLTALERRTIDDLGRLGLDTLFFPVAMNDLVDVLADDPAQARADLLQRAHHHLDPLVPDWDERVHWLDGRGALRARWDRDAHAPRQPVPEHDRTGVPRLEGLLEHFLVHDRGALRRRQLDSTLHGIQQELDARQQLARATAAASAAELGERLEQLSPQLERLDAVAKRVEQLAYRFVDEQAERVWTELRDFLQQTEELLPSAVSEIDVGGLAGLSLLVPSGRERIEQRLHDGLNRWLDRRMEAWRDEQSPRLDEALQALRRELAAEEAQFDSASRELLAAFTTGMKLDKQAHQDPPPAGERWFSVVVGAALLSPGTVAAGWTQGYEGALKGAAGRLGARLGLLALGAVLGPIGWAGLVVYVLTDTLLLLTTGGTELSRTRGRYARALSGRLVQRASDDRENIEAAVREALVPFRDAMVDAAQNDAAALRERLDAVVAHRAQQERDQASDEQAYATATAALAKARAAVADAS